MVCNGSAVGTNSTTYSSSVIKNGDVITCQLTSNSVCRTSTIVNSNVITMTVHPTVTPFVSINASDNNICKGTQVIFQATAFNEGNLPEFIWMKNGKTVGNASPEYYR
jgi:hypothetical protein